MRRNACALSRPNPMLIHRAVPVGGEPGQPRCAQGPGLGASAALISDHVAWLSCGVAESRRRAIAP